MPVFQTSEHLTRVMQALFDQVGQDSAAIRALVKSHLIIRLRITDPQALVEINGRKNPPQLSYAASALQPDLDIQVSADTLDKILRRELRLSAAVAARQLSVHGPVWKSFVLESIFRSAQALYPKVLP